GRLTHTPHPARSMAAAEPLDTVTEVETPEHVRFRYRTAGPARRGLAWLIDALVRGSIGLVLMLVLSIGGVVTGVAGASMGVLLVIAFVLEWVYFVALDVLWSGRSIGKRALGLRVVKEGGHPIRF